ncbi:MAG: hypothetical protein KKH77_03230 [Candidatus Omnitrophica bacterium]|nr:hypothetical protein [Candidatus Omnitrophota bacterium]MBU0881646.1 hypothetical protein [Candidatus Omnitrophota bacterium]MBU0895463.1 hypothetical protein [Candidatus Omnitrophota bacterium]MBU1037892.1 hypothetical protein [Candidatus Omnitrophota bacterium]MBU1809194.1 hypothetical protein [Candidatus Omnitrophota bacterium]
MPNRCVRQVKRDRNYQVNIDTVIERFKKVRALNCNPADVGLDCYIWNTFFANSRSNAISRFL